MGTGYGLGRGAAHAADAMHILLLTQTLPSAGSHAEIWS